MNEATEDDKILVAVYSVRKDLSPYLITQAVINNVYEFLISHEQDTSIEDLTKYWEKMIRNIPGKEDLVIITAKGWLAEKYLIRLQKINANGCGPILTFLDEITMQDKYSKVYDQVLPKKGLEYFSGIESVTDQTP